MTEHAIQPPPNPAPEKVRLPRRLVALFYDVLVATAILFVAATPVVVLFEIDQEHPVYPLFVLYIYGVLFLYLGWFWIHGGQTLGMKTWRFELVTVKGARIDLAAAIFRFAAAMAFWVPAGYGISRMLDGNLWSGLIMFAPLFADYAACVFRSDGMSLHDALSRTKFSRLA